MAKTALKITSKAQVTLRKEFLEHLGLSAGDEVDVEKRPGELVFRARPTGHISDVFDKLRRPGQKRLSIEQINKVIADGWAGKR